MKTKRQIGGLEFELESDDVKQLWKELSEIDELFAETKCGACGSENIVFRVRNVDSNDYYERACNHCRAARAFGVRKKGGKLFPKRKDKEGNYLPNSGWVKYSKVRNDDEEEVDEAPAPTPPKTKTKATKKVVTKKKAEDDEEAPF